MRTKVIFLVLMLGFCLCIPARAATIVWVSFHPADNTPGSGAAGAGFTTATDKGYTDLLQANGFTVTRYVTTATPDAALLNAADLVIISRSVGSANYQNAAATAWNATITAPTMILGGYVIRQNRMGFSTGNTIPDITGDITLTVNDPKHPIFAGVPLSGNAMVNPYAGVVNHPTTGALMRGISIVTEAANANGTVLATVSAGSSTGPAGAVVIAEWPAGATVTHAGGAGTDVLGGPRLVFLTGSRETSGVNSETAGYYDLHPDGARMFINAVRYMTGDTGEAATSPSPEDGAVDVPLDANMSWTPGTSARTHDVYFGTSRADVNDAGRTNPKGVLVSQGQNATTYDPAGGLELGQTYYWRIDEVNTVPSLTISRGTIWSFTAEPFSYPIQNIVATASSSNSTDNEPGKTIDGSGLSADDQHSTELKDMWLSAQGTEPAWIQYEFDKAYKLDQLLVWNSNQALESLLGFGAKDVVVAYSADGEAWTPLGDFVFARAPGLETYTPDVAVDFGGAVAKYVKLTISSNWGGLVAQYSLAEVRFLYIPVQPREPQAPSGATGVDVDTILTWRAGREAVSHQLYFGTDQQAVADGTATLATVADNSFDPGALTLGTTYFWKVVEVNEAAVPGAWAGDVWSFTTREYLPIDDMESYTSDEGSRIYETWIDGYVDNSSGSIVGHLDAPFVERTIVHGGLQSMPFEYNNVNQPYYSEAYREFSPAQNWTVNGADTLVLSLRGRAAGFMERADGTIVMGGGGADIWNAADQFRFAAKPLNGNGTIVAKVESLVDTDPWAKVGVMIRESMDPGARFAAVYATPGNGIRYQARLVNAAAATSDTAVATPEQIALQAPIWLKMERTGNDFKGYYSTDGKTWTAMSWNPQTMAMPSNAYLGLAVTSHNTTTATTAEFSNVSLTGATGAWEVAEIGIAQPSNTPTTLYVVVQDSSGKSKVVTHPDPAITVATDWQQWRIPLSEFTAAGVKTTSVKKMSIGMGEKASPVKGGAGLLYIDDIGFGHPGQ